MMSSKPPRFAPPLRFGALLCLAWLWVSQIEQAEACSCTELSPYYTDAIPSVIGPASELWAYVSPPYGAQEVEVQVVLLRPSAPNSPTRSQVQEVLATTTHHGKRADRHVLRVAPKGRWPRGGSLELRVRYRGTAISQTSGQWTPVRGYRVVSGSLAYASAGWVAAPIQAFGPPRMSLRYMPVLQRHDSFFAASLVASVEVRQPVILLPTSCGNWGPWLQLAFAAERLDTVLIYVNRAPEGFPDSLYKPYDPTGSMSASGETKIALSSGDSTCGSMPLQAGDLNTGTTLGLVPVNQAGRRGEPVKVVVP